MQDTSKRVQERVQTKAPAKQCTLKVSVKGFALACVQVHALQHELREEREISRRFALEEACNKSQ